MIKIHKLEDGDIIKLIPRIVDGEIQWVTQVDSLMYQGDTGQLSVLYDPECKWASKIYYHISTNEKFMNKEMSRSTKYYFNTLTTKGEIKVIAVGKALMNIIIDNEQLMDLKSNWQLNISYPILDNTHTIEADWFCPVDINSADEWMNFITKNQPNLETLFKQNDIYSKRSELINCFGSDIIGQIIGEDRNKKLDKLGI